MDQALRRQTHLLAGLEAVSIAVQYRSGVTSSEPSDGRLRSSEYCGTVWIRRYVVRAICGPIQEATSVSAIATCRQMKVCFVTMHGFIGWRGRLILG